MPMSLVRSSTAIAIVLSTERPPATRATMAMASDMAPRRATTLLFLSASDVGATAMSGLSPAILWRTASRSAASPGWSSRTWKTVT